MMRCAGGGSSRQCLDRGARTAVLVARAGEQEDGRLGVDPVALAGPRALGAQRRMEGIAVDGVVDDVQLRRGTPKRSRISSRTIFEGQITACSHGTREQAPLDAQHVAVCTAKPWRSRSSARRALAALLQPAPRARRRRRDRRRSRAAARAIRRDRPSRGAIARHDRAREAPFAPGGFPRSHGSQITGSISCSRVCGHERVYSEIATLRSSSASSARLEEALGAAAGRVTLADDREAHQ